MMSMTFKKGTARVVLSILNTKFNPSNNNIPTHCSCSPEMPSLHLFYRLSSKGNKWSTVSIFCKSMPPVMATMSSIIHISICYTWRISQISRGFWAISLTCQQGRISGKEKSSLSLKSMVWKSESSELQAKIGPVYYLPCTMEKSSITTISNTREKSVKFFRKNTIATSLSPWPTWETAPTVFTLPTSRKSTLFSVDTTT